MGSVDRIEAVADRVARHHRAGDRVVVVVSAMSGETNRLTGLAHEIDPAPPARELDVLLASSERVSIALLSVALAKRGWLPVHGSAIRSRFVRTIATDAAVSSTSTPRRCRQASRMDAARSSPGSRAWMRMAM